MIRNSRLAAGILALAALGAAPASYAACNYPKAAGQPPDGATATIEQMVTGQKAVKQFIADMDEYLKCIDTEHPPAPAGTVLSEEQKKAQDARERVRVERHNAAVTDEETVGNNFNVQLRIFKEKQKKTS